MHPTPLLPKLTAATAGRGKIQEKNSSGLVRKGEGWHRDYQGSKEAAVSCVPAIG